MSVLDLTRNPDFTFTLLSDTWAWRQRLVESFVLGSTWHASVRSSYQVELPAGLLEPFASDDPADAVRAIFPLTTRPKRPLLGFDVEGPNGTPAHLLLRLSIAAIQAEYLAVLRDQTDPDLAEKLPDRLLEAICVFTPAVYREFDEDGGHKAADVTSYLTSGLGFAIGEADVSRWLELEAATGRRLAAALDEPGDRFSSSEHVLLALPRLDPLPTSTDEIDALLRSYADAVRTVADGAPLLASALAEYGRRWEVLIETTVPVAEASTITLVERRPLVLRRRKASMSFASGDARSAHAAFYVDDPAVEIDAFEVADGHGRDVGVPNIEGVRTTPEALALYSAEPDRPYYLDVELRLRPSREVRVVQFALELLVVAAVVVAFRRRDRTWWPRSASRPCRPPSPWPSRSSERRARCRAGFASGRGSGCCSRLPCCGSSPSSARSDEGWRTFLEQEAHVAKNGARGGGRVGAVRGRSQSQNPMTGLWSKRDTQSGRFVQTKKSGGSFKGVRKEK
ncbi:MAG: hypothetical protein M3Q48_09845 [Actinomycetota bacterium]|nr:hypothetical protein [Actinomycetota bacterium]